MTTRPWYQLPDDIEQRAFLRGLSQFNAGEFYEAHDTWEEIWQQLDGEPARFYQTLIQTAVIFVHMQNGNAAGVRAVYESLCRRNFPKLPDTYRGVDLRELRRSLTLAVEWIVSRPPGAWRGAARRTAAGEAILFDPGKVFRIPLVSNVEDSP